MGRMHYSLKGVHFVANVCYTLTLFISGAFNPWLPISPLLVKFLEAEKIFPSKLAFFNVYPHIWIPKFFAYVPGLRIWQLLTALTGAVLEKLKKLLKSN